MAYWLDDGFDTWPEVIRAGKAATGLYVCCGAWIARNLTDGFIPAEIATMYGTPEWVTKLVAAGLWETVDGGYRDVFYLESRDGTKLNPPAEKVSERKAAKAERQRRWLEKRAETQETRKSHGSRRSKDASQDRPRDLPPALPPSKEGTGARARAARSTQEPNNQTSDASQDTSRDDSGNPDWRTLPAPVFLGESKPRPRLSGLAGGPRCDTHPGQPAGNCALCLAENLGGDT